MNQLTEKELFETVLVPRAVARLIIPTIISQIVTVIYNLADTFFIGQIGDPAMVAGATLVSPWFNLLTALSNLVGIGGISVMDKLLGRHEYDDVKKVSAFSFWAGVVITALFCGLTFAFARPLLSLLSIAGGGENGDGALGYAYSYMLWTVVIGGLPTMLAMTLAHFLRGEGRAKQASAGMMLGGILNIGLDPLFMFAFGLGFVGAGMATALSNFISFLFLLGVFLHGAKTSTMSLSPRWFSFRYTGKVFSVGLSAAFTTLLANVVFMIINILAYGYGTQAVSAYGIVKRLDRIPLGISLGLSQGVMPLIAYNYGSGDYARLKKVSVFSWILAAIMAAVLPQFLAQKGGHIIVTSSVAGTRSVPGNAVYCGTKHFVRAMLDSFRQECVAEGSNIRTTTIFPGAIKTELLNAVAPSETKKAVEAFYENVGISPSAIADAVLYALSQPDGIDVSDIVVRPVMEG